MFIRNFTNEDLPLDVNGTYLILTKNTDTLVPDGIVTADELKKLFGTSVQVVSTSSVTTSTLALQQVVSVGKLYCTDPISDEVARLYISTGATIDVLGSDDITPPTALSQMACPDENKGVTGVQTWSCYPRYVAFKTVSGTPTIVSYGLKFHEVGDIS